MIKRVDGKEAVLRRISNTPAAIRWVAAALPLACCCLLAGCGASPQEKLIHDACQALKAQDWEAYSHLTITEADYLMRQNRIAETEAENSFAGETMRPRQRGLLREQFDRAVRGGPRQLDFGRCQFVFPTLERRRKMRTLSGEEVPLEEYVVAIEMDGPQRSAPGLGPIFVLAEWEDGFRIIGLRFTDER